jgi:hypothetical protein
VSPGFGAQGPVFKKLARVLMAVAVVLSVGTPARAHIGNKDVFEQVSAGPYKLFITIRTPTVIPGVAMLEVRSSGAPIDSLTITPLLLTGEASKHPPTPDAMKRSKDDPQFFTGSLWLMGTGSWQIRFGIHGASGAETTSVPVAAAATAILRMQRPMGIMLGALGVILVLGIVGIVTAAVREARLKPGAQPNEGRRRRAALAGVIALAFSCFAVYWGGKWWNVEAADYATDMHRNAELRPTIDGNRLNLLIGEPDKDADGGWMAIKNGDMLLDHGHLMHLYAIREPEMDAVFHLHPEPTGKQGLSTVLPAMPAGNYKLYGDVVFLNGFPETETATLTVPADVSAAPLGAEDASAAPPPLSAGELGPTYKLPDGYTMVWDRPATITASTPYAFRFTLLDGAGKPAGDMQPYLGMAGHAAFVKTDGTTFAHTHPEGSAAMPAMMLAEESTMAMGGMNDMSGMAAGSEPVKPAVEFPYGFPSVGRYRIFVQMKHSGTVETGVFDAEVK